MPAALLESQFAALEPPADAIAIDVAATPDDCVAAIVARLPARMPRSGWISRWAARLAMTCSSSDGVHGVRGLGRPRAGGRPRRAPPPATRSIPCRPLVSGSVSTWCPRSASSGASFS